MWHYHGTRLRALLFDVDGTLYRQSWLRRAMLRRIARTYLRHPLRGFRTLRMLQSYRQAQEVLRKSAGPVDDLYAAQLALACDHAPYEIAELKAEVDRWMEKEPLTLLPGRAHAHLEEMLAGAKAGGLRLGVYSDYPAERKLESLSLRDYFDVVVSSCDPEVRSLKPAPRGFMVALARLGVDPAEAAYIGDRLDVDGAGAAALSMPCFILCRSRMRAAAPSGTTALFHDYRELKALLCQP